MICTLCHKPAAVLIPKGTVSPQVAVYRCRPCGVDFLGQTGAADYWDTLGQEEIYEDAQVAAERADSFNSILKKLEAFRPVGSLLDVGAGKGEFAILAARRGWKVSVVEPSSRATEGLAQRGIREVLNSPFEDFRPQHGYDCVTFLDVLEHTRDPLKVLRQAADCLQPGGVFVALTPDARSLVRRLALVAARLSSRFRGLLRYQYYVPHLFYLSEKALTRLVRQAGLQACAVEHTATPKRFLLAKLKRHYAGMPGNGFFRAAISAAYPLARLGLTNKLVVYAWKPRQ